MTVVAASAKPSGAAHVMTERPLQPSKSMLYLTLVSAALLRLGLSLHTNAFETLQDRPELSTPFSSLKSLLETHYLFQHPPTPVSTLSAHQIPDPYSAGTIHHSPLLLPVLNYAVERMQTGDRVPAVLIWTAADLVGGWLLYRICLAREVAEQARLTHLWTWHQSRALKVAAIFLFNPYTLATCIAQSTISLEAVALLATVHAAMSGRLLPLPSYFGVTD